MVAEGQRATRLRERGSIAPTPPRVPRPAGSLTSIAAAGPKDALSALRIFDAIPEHHHGVTPVQGNGAAPLLRKGEVAVYETFERHIHGPIVDGGLYVIEYQTPAHGMPREMFARFFADDHGARLRIDRAIVRVSRCKHNPDRWNATSIKGSASLFGLPTHVTIDGYDEPGLCDRLIGVVVGIYRGAAA